MEQRVKELKMSMQHTKFNRLSHVNFGAHPTLLDTSPDKS